MQLQTPGVVEIVEDGYYLSIKRGFLLITKGHHKIENIPLDDIHALILTARQLTLSRQVLVKMAERGIPTVVSGSDFMPIALLTPLEAHHLTAAIIQAQILAKSPIKKRLWQKIVQQKIQHQSIVLRMVGNYKDADTLARMVAQVKSGDSTYMESIAARFYWPRLFDKNFVRNRSKKNINSALNYGYAILRASVARSICGAGLLPSLGIHHSNKYNSFQLVDDLMEPWRPLVDWRVCYLQEQLKTSSYLITPEIKKSLTSVLQFDLNINNQITPLYIAIIRQAKSLAESFVQKKNLLVHADIDCRIQAPM